MLSVQCGWVLSCLVVALLHQRATAAAAAAATAAATPPTPDQPSPPPSTPAATKPHTQQQKAASTTAEPDAEAQAGVTCYICVNVSNNHECNLFAIDRPCPQGQEFCHTLHIIDSRNETVIVNKKCADREECSPERVGCLVIDTQKVCSSCCDEMYCNKEAPTDAATAVFTDSRTRALDARRLPAAQPPASRGAPGRPLSPGAAAATALALALSLALPAP